MWSCRKKIIKTDCLNRNSPIKSSETNSSARTVYLKLRLESRNDRQERTKQGTRLSQDKVALLNCSLIQTTVAVPDGHHWRFLKWFSQLTQGPLYVEDKYCHPTPIVLELCRPKYGAPFKNCACPSSITSPEENIKNDPVTFRLPTSHCIPENSCVKTVISKYDCIKR